MTKQPKNFDFEYWAKLAKDDPKAFEAERKMVIDAEIAKAPEHMRARLERLQWRVDMERRRCKNPLSSALRLYNMMWDQVYSRGGLVQALDGLLDIKGAVTKQDSADILRFRTGSE